jgi:hypothetical protein
VAVFVPLVVSLAVTVMVAVPADTGVTVAPRPLPLTVATPMLLQAHVTSWFVASHGSIVGRRLPATLPTVKTMVALSRAIPVTGTLSLPPVTV